MRRLRDADGRESGSLRASGFGSDCERACVQFHAGAAGNDLYLPELRAVQVHVGNFFE